MNIVKLLNFILNQNRITKQLIVFFNDIIISFFSIFFTFYIIVSDSILNLPISLFYFILLINIFYIPFFIYFGLYNTIFSYSDQRYLLKILFATIIYSTIFILLYFFTFMVNFEYLTLGPAIIHPIIFFTLVSFSRILIIVLVPAIKNYKNPKSNILIYGLTNGYSFFNSLSNDFNIIGFIDDDKTNIGKKINNVSVFEFNQIEDLKNKYNIHIIYFATDLFDKVYRQKIISKLNDLKLSIRSLKKSNNENYYNFNISDIVSRKIFKNIDLIDKSLSSKIVLVTGAGGSIGAELCQQIANANPQQLIILDHSEYFLFEIYKKLEKISLNKEIKFEIIPIVASINDKKRVNDIFDKYSPEIIFHSAAYKHVHLMENNHYSVIKNNIFGSINIMDASVKYKIENFVLVSTDKAVRPTSIMGRTKRISEMYLQAIQDKMNTQNLKTKFSIVRFGNVLGSSGSVIPIFKNQIISGGPVKVTDSSVNRFFMLIPEASNLVLQTLFLSKGGDIFILNMGEPFKIKDLAEKMIRLNGFLPTYNKPLNPLEIQIIFTGLAKGEKLYEELLIGNNPITTQNPDIFKTFENFPKLDKINIFLNNVQERIAKNDLHLIDSIIIDFIKNNDIS